MPIRRKNDDPKGKPSPKIKEPKKRKSRPDHHDDDSSVDSHGNIRDLIEYASEDSDSPSDRDTTPVSKKPSTPAKSTGRPPKRQAAIAAEKKIERKLASEEKKRKERRKKQEEKEAEEEEKDMVRKSRSTKKSPKPTVSDEESEEEEDAIVLHRKRGSKKTPRPAVSEDEDSEEEEESRKKRVGRKKIPTPASETESEYDYEAETDSEEEDEDEYDEDEYDEDEDDYDEDEDDEEEDAPRGRSSIELLISDLGGGDYRQQKPKKYKLNKEPENVRRFVKLVQTEVDPNEDDIDRDIGYFKGLTPGAQDRLLTKLRIKVEPAEPTVPLKFQIMNKDVPSEVERVAMAKYTALMNIDPSSTEYYKASQWLHGYTQLPLGLYKDLPVKIEDGSDKCQEFMTSVSKYMESAIYGHDEAKLQIMQFVSSWIANPKAAGNVLSIHGPPGVGKTTLVKDGVAKALGRPFHFITLGGATDASFLDGHSYTYEGSVWGRIVDVLIKSKCMNPVIYFDELDKVSETPKGEEINNLLIHLTDGSQNDRFQDKYFTGIDLDLSRCLFIFSHNNHERVNPILRDRMYNIQVDGFGLKEKLVIAENYLVSQALREVNLFEKISISKEIITHIIENFTGDEKGVRELKRAIQTVISKVNLLRFYNDPVKVPFAIKGFALPFILKKEHIDLFLKKKADKDPSIAHLYT